VLNGRAAPKDRPPPAPWQPGCPELGPVWPHPPRFSTVYPRLPPGMNGAQVLALYSR